MIKTTAISSWFHYWQRKPGTRARVFCFPYAGGGASIFRRWSEQAPADIEICAIQLPGRENRLLEAPFSDLPSLLHALTLVLLPYLDLPYAFFGHSMGALISFEITRYIRHMSCAVDPISLFVSGRRAPQVPDDDPPTYALPELEFIEELRRLQGTPEEVLQNEELLRLVLPALRADFTLGETYIYKHEKPLKCRISAFGGLSDEDVTRNMLASWREQTSSSFKMRFFPGNHFFILKEQDALFNALYQDLYHFIH